MFSRHIHTPPLRSASLGDLQRQTLWLWLSGKDEVTVLEVSWPDGRFYTRTLLPGEKNSVVEVTYPKEGDTAALSHVTQVSP